MKLFFTPYILTLLLSISAFVSKAQYIKGKVVDESNYVLPYAEVSLRGEGFLSTTLTDSTGSYLFENIPLGVLTLSAHYLGYEAVTKELNVKKDQSYTIDVTLSTISNILQELEVVGQSEAKILKSSAYAVDVIAIKAYKNLNVDLNQLLNKTAGIHIRSVGGLGSSFNLSLNGLSGNRIRYFVDGIPMENLGTALNLNNYPVNLVRSIEVYKGVVPISLSADALGGAINIVSDYKGKTFLDASYSYGSFNTHQVALNAQYSKPTQGYFITLNGFFNHSDNNYWMNDLPVYDALGNKVDTINTCRFHDQYTSGMLRLSLGILDKAFADELSVSFVGALNRNNYQNPDNNIKLTFGDYHTKNQTFSAQAIYKKRFKKVSLKAFTQWSAVTESVIDTSRKKYNWAGEYWFRDTSSFRGELNERQSLFVLNDKLVNSSVQLSYQAHPRHQLDWTVSQNFLHRKGKDKVDKIRRSFVSPSFIHKNLLSMGYSINTKNKRLEATLFGKGYWFNANLVTQDYTNNAIVTTTNSFFGGYGILGTYRFPKKIQVKLSYERAYRLPESYEILGDGIYIQPNAGLQAEESHNINAGFYTVQSISAFQFNYELNIFYRNAQNYIRFVPLGPFGSYENINNVGVLGAETGLLVQYKRSLSLEANITYQHLTDETAFDEGLPNTNYKSRIPNIPYLFANFRLGYHLNLKLKDLNFAFFWSGRYVHEFYLTWEKLGNSTTKNTIPSQFIQDLNIECSWKNGKYNLAATLNNFTNAKAYDNFNIQKPGIAFYLKLRCFFLK